MDTKQYVDKSALFSVGDLVYSISFTSSNGKEIEEKHNLTIGRIQKVDSTHFKTYYRIEAYKNGHLIAEGAERFFDKER